MADNNNLVGSTMAAALTAAVLSPRIRGVLRSGVVQGLAGALIAGDAISSFARGVGRGLQEGNTGPAPTGPQPEAPTLETVQAAARAAQEAAQAAQAAAEAAQAAARPRASTRSRKSAGVRGTAPSAEKSEL